MDAKTSKVSTEQINFNNIFLLSDVHFGVRANSIEWVENHMRFFYDFYIPYLKETKKDDDVLFILGDWFDNRQLLDIYVMNTSIDIVIELAKILPVHFITGNHDIYKKHNTDVNSISAFRFIPNVFIYEKPKIITNGDCNILILPWVGDGKEEEKYVKDNDANYVFAHTNIAGFNYDNGRQICKGANFTDITGIKRLFSGHIHKRQEYQQYIYIGSPFSTKRSDIGNVKGVYYFKTKTNEVEFTENTFSPIFQKIKLDFILDKTLDEAIQLLDNNYTDIIVPDKYIHIFNLTKFVDILDGCNYKRIETDSEEMKMDEELSEFMENVDIKDILSLLEMSIEDLNHQMEVLVKLKLLNKKYYEKASATDIE